MWWMNWKGAVWRYQLKQDGKKQQKNPRWCMACDCSGEQKWVQWKRIKKQAADTNSAIQVDGNIDAVWWRLPGEDKMKSLPHSLCSVLWEFGNQFPVLLGSHSWPKPQVNTEECRLLTARAFDTEWSWLLVIHIRFLYVSSQTFAGNPMFWFSYIFSSTLIQQ